MLNKVRNIFIVFIVSGFWHGAAWNFIIWGALNALYFLPLLLTNNNRNHLDVVANGKYLPSFKEFKSMLLTFSLTVLAWIFFRAENLGQALQYISDIFHHPGSYLLLNVYWKYKTVILLIVIFIGFEWFGRNDQFAIARLSEMKSRLIPYFIYFLIFVSILLFNGEKQEFVYFQF